MKEYFRLATRMHRPAAPRLVGHLAGPLIAIVILIPSLRIAPVGDDYRVIETAQPLSLSAIVRDLHLGSRGGPHYRPSEPISLRIEHLIWGESPWGYHLTNILLHASSAWLTSRIALSLSASWPMAMIAGMLFAVHPLAVPAVGQIAARNSLLVCFFLLLCGWLFLRYRASNRRSALVLSVAAFGMALLSKEQAYLFPAVLLPLALDKAGTNSEFPGFQSRTILIVSILLFSTAALLLARGGEFVFTVSAWEYGNYDLKLQIGQYGYALGAVSLFLLALGIAIPHRPETAVLVWYVLLEGFVMFFGLLPSGKLAAGASYIEGSPFSFSYDRLARDVFVLLTTLGILDFNIRGVLVQTGHNYPAIIAVLWLISGLLLSFIVAVQRRRMLALASLVWLIITLSPLRIRPVEFFEMNNLYLAMPLIAIAAAALTKLGLDRRRYLTIPILSTVIVLWATYSIDAQKNLITMGRFARELHSVLKGEAKDNPGPLRVIVNLPDPFRSTSEDQSLAHWMVFRIAQSAMQLGGYSPENVAFVEEKVIQVLAVGHDSACQYEASVLGQNSILVGTSSKQTEAKSCLSKLRLIDFIPEAKNLEHSVVAYRRLQYSVLPLTQAELYFFDGNTLHRLAGA